MERIFVESILAANLGKERLAVWILSGETARLLEQPGLANEADSTSSFTQAGMVELSSSFQASEQASFLGRSYAQRHFAHTRGGASDGSSRVIGKADVAQSSTRRTFVPGLV